ncbi:MAG: adenylyltransferase/cytidyltransferase family protein [Candidatus Nanosalina sp.]
MKAAFIGRFQPFHLGHRHVIEKYREEFEELYIVIGSAGESRTEENPLTAEERRKVIRACYPDLEIHEIEDEEKDEEGNRKWIGKIEDETDADAIISRNDLVREIVESFSDLDLVEQDLHDPDVYSGTEIRRRIRSGEEWRYLVPDCAEERISKLEERIRESGIQYEFEPGWKKENAYHGTAEK